MDTSKVCVTKTRGHYMNVFPILPRLRGVLDAREDGLEGGGRGGHGVRGVLQAAARLHARFLLLGEDEERSQL